MTRPPRSRWLGPSGEAATRAPAGASFCYARDAPAPYEAQEVRAFGLLLADLVARLAPAAPARPPPAPVPGPPDAGGVALGGALAGVAGECLAAAPAQRPAFAALARRLERLAAVRGGALLGWQPALSQPALNGFARESEAAGMCPGRGRVRGIARQGRTSRSG
jgi:hypothetical protein